jgi:hypothetical protein
MVNEEDRMNYEREREREWRAFRAKWHYYPDEWMNI